MKTFNFRYIISIQITNPDKILDISVYLHSTTTFNTVFLKIAKNIKNPFIDNEKKFFKVHKEFQINASISNPKYVNTNCQLTQK